MTRPPVSVFMIAFNEAARIGRTLEAVKDWADEIVVVDSGSTDDTVAIATAVGARVIRRDFDGYGQQKRFAEDQCRNDWLLNIDADEVVTSALRAEIDTALDGAEPCFFRMRILNIYPGDDAPRPLADDYNVVRLYHRAVGRYRDHPLFDRVEAHGPVATRQLSEPIHHYPFLTWGDLVAKLDRLATLQAREAKRKPEWQLYARLVLEGPVQFLKFWLLRRHILGGWKGFAFSGIAAFGRWLRIVKLIDAQRRDQATSAP